ncbi:MAG TPA: ubiquitin-like domain-containing protein [Candidatus Saccharimonadales bacterium]|nr:ubiquitin-like domain-containing protein [Candidatus Saccharimonadales bacterium]
MRFIPDFLTKPFRAAHHAGRHHIRQRPYILPLFGLLLGGAIVALMVYGKNGGYTYRPSDSHVVFVFDSGKKQTIDTKAPTVGELIKRLDLHLIPQDVVEPSADTPIVEDNFRINIYHARPVTIVDGGVKSVTLTAQKSARVVAQQAGLKVKPEDIATFSQGDIRDNIIGEQVIVSRATPISLNLYGTEVPSYTQAHTVEQMLSEKHIVLDNGEKVDPGVKTPITPGMHVFILAKGSHVETSEVPIDFPISRVNDFSLSFGTTVVRQKGEPGKQAITYLISAEKDGSATRKVIQRAIIESPVPQIEAIGATIDINSDKTAIMAQAGISPGDYAYANFIVSHESTWRVTAANPSGAYGLCQALPGGKMASAGSDWRTNPITQLRWCSGYAARSYGGWAGAYNHWLSYRSW